ncbi:hypothetical protein [Crocosphaera sp.]|uniref:hypothetical protein n=1 Tax=Crocosphaera sp. TaxID=2729996 RepID=UPI00260D29C6|nr:hypothetical protein [Crocosphaera sp.]MDJ0579042.1 hypothetical protein [Crocosphaera sp.]
MLDKYLSTANEVLADLGQPTANATLTLEDITDVTIFEDEHGNMQPTNTTTTTVLTCWLCQKKPPENDVQVGLNQDREYFEGELITPKTYDFPIVSDGVDIVVNGRSGKFYPVKKFETPASETWDTKSFLGQKIAGWVQFEEGN